MSDPTPKPKTLFGLNSPGRWLMLGFIVALMSGGLALSWSKGWIGKVAPMIAPCAQHGCF